MNKIIKNLIYIAGCLCFLSSCSGKKDDPVLPDDPPVVEPTEYTVNFYFDGTLVHSEKYEENSLITKYEVSKEGCVIGDYYVKDDPEKVWIFAGENADVLTSDIDLECKSYPETITFTLDYGEYDIWEDEPNGEIESLTVKYGSSYTLPTPIYDRYAFSWPMYFDGWLLDGKKIESTGTWNYLTHSDKLVADFKYVLDEEIIEKVYKFKLLDDGTYSISGVSEDFGHCVIIPNQYKGIDITNIEEDAFKDEDVYGLHISKNIKNIDTNTFGNECSLNFVTVDIDNPVYTDCNGSNIIVEKATNKLIKGSIKAIIPEGITTIVEKAFDNCAGLDKINLPSTLTTIEDEAFIDCYSLKLILLKENIKNIGAEVFKGCENLTIYTTCTERPIGWNGNFDLIETDLRAPIVHVKGDIFIKDGVKYIETVVSEVIVLGADKDLENIVIPSTINGSTVTEIAPYSFEYTILKNITLPNTIKKIGNEAFCSCELEDIVLHDGLEYIGSWALADTKIKKIILPNSLTYLGDYAFNACDDVTELVICTGLEVLPDGVFSGCDSLKDIVIPEGVKRLEGSPFYNCANIETIILPSTLEFIDTYSFAFAEKLTTLFIPINVTQVAIYGLAFLPNCHFYVEASEKPVGWDNSWSYSSGDVTWGASRPE